MEFREQDLTGTRFERVSLRDATFTKVHLNGAGMHAVDFTGVQVRGALFNQSRMRGVELVDIEISGELRNVVVNGVDIAPLVDAESWSGCGRAPSRVPGHSPKRRRTAASTASGPSSRPCGTSTSPALPGRAG